MAVYAAADTVRVHRCVRGLNTAVYMVVYTCTRPVHGRVTAMYTACSGRAHGCVRAGRCTVRPVYGRIHGRVHGCVSEIETGRVDRRWLPVGSGQR